ncbi:MAG: hypothetical protein H6707_02505 [Deltaproteobacteria bacterium]|nr:hypothetical protein [Deltaproteobacteria bacterium]
MLDRSDWLALFFFVVLATVAGMGCSATTDQQIDPIRRTDGGSVLDTRNADIGTPPNDSATKRDSGDVRPDVDGATPAICANGARQCNNLQLRVCANAAWTTFDCQAVCQAEGKGNAVGCGHDAAKGFDACLCVGAPTCQEGAFKCFGLKLAKCVKGRWDEEPCATFCTAAKLGPPTSCSFDAKLGHEICQCAPPTPAKCTNGSYQCASATEIQKCAGTTWSAPIKCQDLCDINQLGLSRGCGIDRSSGAHNCFCWLGRIGDECEKDSHCAQGVCNTKVGYCSQSCSSNAQCGTNADGLTNWCISSFPGGSCAAGCYKDTDCKMFSRATRCALKLNTVEGTTAPGACSLP